MSELSVSSATKWYREQKTNVKKCQIKLHNRPNEAKVTDVAFLDEAAVRWNVGTHRDRCDKKSLDKALYSSTERDIGNRTHRKSGQKLSSLVGSVKSLFLQWLQLFADQIEMLQKRLKHIEAAVERELQIRSMA